MKKLLFLILLIPTIVSAQWLNVGNTLQRSTDAYNYRTALGSPGFAYWYTKGQVDSINTANALNFSNGLTKTGSTVKLGGVLTANTAITTGGYLLNFIGDGGIASTSIGGGNYTAIQPTNITQADSLDNSLYLSPIIIQASYANGASMVIGSNSFSASSLDGNYQNFIVSSASSGYLTMQVQDTSNSNKGKGILFDLPGHAITITDDIDNKGAKYPTKYYDSDPNWLAPKWYIDSLANLVVNSNVGSFGTASNVSHITVTAQGKITAASNTPIQIAESQVNNLTTDLAAKLPTQTFLNYTRNAARFGLTTSDTIGHYDNSGGDNTFRVGGWINCRTITSDTVKMKVVFTDNHSSVQTIYLYRQGTTVPYATTATYMAFPTIDFRALNGTTITTSVVVTGSGSISYEAGTTITKIVGN